MGECGVIAVWSAPEVVCSEYSGKRVVDMKNLHDVADQMNNKECEQKCKKGSPEFIHNWYGL